MSEEHGSREKTAEELAYVKTRLSETYKNLRTIEAFDESVYYDVYWVVCNCSRKGSPEEKELLNITELLVTEATWPFFVKEARSHIRNGSRITELDDLHNAFYEKVVDELPRYKPPTPFPVFFDKRVKTAFERAVLDGIGNKMSHHYYKWGPAIRRAEAALEAKGIKNPTPEEIHAYILYMEGKNIPAKTIIGYYSHLRETMPFIEDRASAQRREMGASPEEMYLEKERRERFVNVKARLPKMPKLVMDLRHRYTIENDEVPDIKETKKLLEEETGKKYTEAAVSSLITTAEQIFIRNYVNYEKYETHAPVNKMLQNKFDMSEQMETMDIMAAMEEDIYMFGPELEGEAGSAEGTGPSQEDQESEEN